MFSDGKGTPDTTTAGEDDLESPFEFMVNYIFSKIQESFKIKFGLF